MKYINEENLRNTSFINKDFQTLWTELLELVPKLTNKWDPSAANESDPLAVLLKLCAIVADKTNYNIDKNILELYPLSLSQLRSAYGVYDALGYNPKWYISANTSLTLSYNGAYANDKNIISNSIILPQFTAFCDEDASIVYTTTEELPINKNTPCVLTVPAIQGTINDLTINGQRALTSLNLDALNRIYFPQTNIAQNGVFVSSDPDSFSLDAQTDAHWKQVEELYQQPLHTKCFVFKIDPITGSAYLEFPSDIGSLIGAGIYIKYITSAGENGNIKANTISRFMYDDLKLINAEEATTARSLSEIFSVNNTVAVKNGYNPESIEDMYRNYKKTANLLNTLVTLLDYQNYITTCTDRNARNIVSNVQVSDRTNDLYCSVPVRTLSVSGEGTSTELYADITLNEHGGIDVSKNVDAFSLRFYPTDYADVVDRNTYDKTFDAQSLTALQNTIENHIADVKAINHNYLDPRKPIVIPYALKAVIYLHTKVSRTDAIEVETNVKQALYESFSASKLEFGVAPDYSTILTVMENSDRRIKHVALEPPVYGKRDANNNVIEDYLTEYNTYISKNTAGINNVKFDVTERSILSGATPFTQFDTDFVADYNQANTKRIHKLPSSSSVEGLGILDTINESTDSIDIAGFEIDLTSHESTEDKKAHVTKLMDEAVYTVSSGVDFENTANASMFEVKENEDISLFAPQYNVVNTYANFLYFFCVDSSGSSNEVPVDAPYRLSSNQTIYVFETRSAAVDACETPNLRRNASYIIEADSIVRFSDREGRHSTFKFTSNPNKDTDIYNMSTYITVDVLEKAEGTIKAANGESTLLMCTNSAFLSNALTSANRKYTLRTGEYLLYSDMNGLEVGIISEGSTLWSNTGISSLYVLPTTTLEDALLGDIGTVSSTEWTAVSSEELHYQLNTILTFGEGYKFKFSDNGKHFVNWIGTGDAFDIYSNDNSVSLLYKLGDEDWTALDPVLAGDTWQGIIRLHLSIADKPQKLAYVHDDDEVTHVQKVSIEAFYTSSGERFSASAEITAATNSNTYVDSNLAFVSVGGCDIVLTESESENLCFITYTSERALNNTTYFRDFTDIAMSVGDTKIVHLPGQSSQYVIVPVIFTADNPVYYLCRGDIDIQINTFSNGNITRLGTPIVVKSDAKIYTTSGVINLSSLLGVSENFVALTDYLYHEKFNPTYKVPETDLIEKPADPATYFNKQHPFNRFCLAKFDDRISSIKVSSLSIQS